MLRWHKMEERNKGKETADSPEDFKEYFPSIYEEIVESNHELEENETRTSTGSKSVRKFRGYNPSITDFICRCKTDEEALEIIKYMLEKGEITEEEEKAIKKQLEEKGLESFGPHREAGYYERA